MADWNRCVRQALVSGTAASLLSVAMLALAGHIERLLAPGGRVMRGGGAPLG